MTVIFSKKCEYGIQAALYLSTKDEGEIIPADEIARKLAIPKEFVAKILQNLTESKIISSKKGKSGGFSLAKSPKKIRLLDIVKAIDGLELFEKCVLGFPNCSSLKPCPVHHHWGELRSRAYDMLTEESLEDLKNKSIEKIKSI